MGFSIRRGLHVEHLDDTILVLEPDSDSVLVLQGDQAAAFTLAEHGVDDVPDPLASAMAGLIELGIVRTDSWTRRRVIQLGGAAAAAAVAVTALPGIAAAESPPGTGIPTPTAGLDIEYLIVAGGGGGGYFGGGGAGGVLTGTFTDVGLGTYTVVVGDGGAVVVNDPNGRPGQDSSLSVDPTIVALGGGGGGGAGSDGQGGGSGGGAGGDTRAISYEGGDAIDPSQGHDGGDNPGGFAGGGGGGAGASGHDSPEDQLGGAGGDGIPSALATAAGIGDLIGSDRWIGGGGGAGGGYTGNTGGKGGGGTGWGGARDDQPTSGAPNTGGGGGAVGASGSTDGNGGSGVVIVAYPTAQATALGWSTSGGSPTVVGSTTCHAFTTVGTAEFTITD